MLWIYGNQVDWIGVRISDILRKAALANGHGQGAFAFLLFDKLIQVVNGDVNVT